MANRFFNPDEQFGDATGLPYAGGSLTFYASGTTTPLNTYSDKALTIANTNPVVLDSAGRAGSVFLQNLAYKVVLSDVNNNVVWTFDPVYSSDFSAVAQFQSGSGSPNGVLAGSAGSSTIPASVYWDATNNILYVCTQTGSSSTAVWTAINGGSTTAAIPQPQGYLTLTSGTPVITGDVTGTSTVYYTPYIGSLIPIYNGTTFTLTTFSELSLALVSSHAANAIYDIFVFNNNGVLTLVTGPAWSNSVSRGTGAGTTQLSRISGLLVNTVQITARNGSTTYTIPANQATYVGSMLINSTPGQVTCTRAIGQSRIWGIFNAYNRVAITMSVLEPTASWSGSFTVRPSNNSQANRCTMIMGLAEESVVAQFNQNLETLSTGNSGVIGMGWNSISAFSPMAAISNLGVPSFLPYSTVFYQPPFLGVAFVQALESSTGTNLVMLGGGTNYLMTASFMA